jgi:hypothetical protein
MVNTEQFFGFKTYTQMKIGVTLLKRLGDRLLSQGRLFRVCVRIESHTDKGHILHIILHVQNIIIFDLQISIFNIIIN